MTLLLINQSPEERLKMAREKVQVCLDQLIEAASLRVHADVFAFSDLVRAQIPASRAAHAYNDLADTLLEKVLLATARFWDPPDDYEANVLTIIALISDDGVRQLLVKEAGDIYRHQRSTEPQILASFADQNERKTARSLVRLDRLVPFVEKSSRLDRIRNHRNKHFAHRTALTRREIKLGTPITPPKFSDVDWVLRRTRWCVDILNQTIRQAGFAFSEAEDIARAQAMEFWSKFRWEG
jgi:hypothetical protein